MNPPAANPLPSEDRELFDQLMEWSGLGEDPRWQTIADQPETRARIVAAVKQIAELPNVQAEQGVPVQFVYKKHVFNLRPLVVPVVVSIFVQATLFVAPGLDSALIPVLEAIDYAEKVREVYRVLTDDEVDVFGAVADLHKESELQRGLTNPGAHATAFGVRAWFERKDYEAPSDIDGTLASLVKKGALLGDTLADGQTLYSPTFLGKKEHHG
ncbi:hypothetical protein [uncultured Paludibaculum sp.]|uniref:hypothetical protein n=1 Tax=uncultured Paludibaculum sp. TaxID=1765020 RepID=UPI002AAC3C3F|nr:hypothetical protein [uncultured Paludibaculum sp.]